MVSGTKEARGSFASSAGFILAAVGSAVGLGNMWKFSYTAAQGGGAAFVVLYLGFISVVGIPLMTAEFVVGRMAQESPVAALRRLAGPGWAPLGWLFAACGLGILSYYSVIAGWTLRYTGEAALGLIPADTADHFVGLATGVTAVGLHVVFMGITAWVVLGGVHDGIERASQILMPLLFLSLAGLAVWAFTLSGSGEGYGAYLEVNLDELFEPRIIANAAGQAFFSLSLGMGALMTYASYLSKKENLAGQATIVSLADFGVAFVAGLIVFPIVYSFGLAGDVSESTVGALFIALPKGLLELGSVGRVVLTVFFVMLIFAALTSAISLLEVLVSAAMDTFGWTRPRAALTAGAAVTLLGIPSALSLDFLTVADALMGEFLLIVGGLFTAILVGYRIVDESEAELAHGVKSEELRRGWVFLVRYVVPPILAVVIYYQARALVATVASVAGG